MGWLPLIAYFFGGAFLSNAIPHLVSGVRGEAFQSPFAKPPGKGLSSATVNVLWGACNLLVAYLLLVQVGRFDPHSPVDAGACGAGLLVMSLFAAKAFGPLHGGAR
ncbi:hypothetical protein [Lichenifustis flavocetrariae]|uniref:Uncharacterized protein n=1 Tax=Lichenifustis flavocetrariae TaxID=2949735 RepID=A0AA42CLG5_9HYPH|nr:hypothetical protein [Lichenifustis flavocetrariae]MCW6510381.1 hypothetical protein [Lichenifustis flavocetrariae]